MSRSADLARLERLLAAVPGVVWEADARSRRLLYVSDAARDLVGTPSQLLVADPARAWELVHPDDRSAIVDAVERAAEGGLERVRFRVLATTGGLLWLQSSVRLLDDGILGGLVHDLGDEIRSELHLNVQRALTQAIAGSAALEEAAEAIVGELCRAFDWGVGAMWLVDEKGDGRLRLVAAYASPLVDAGAFLAESARLRLAAGEGLPGRALAAGAPIWVASVQEYAPFRRPESAAASGLDVALAFPVTSAGRAIGVLEFYAREARQPDESLAAVLGTFGAQIGQLVERIHAERARRASDARSRAYLRAALDAVVLIGPEGRVIEWNPAAEKMFGYSREEALGRELAELVVPETLRPSHRAALSRYAETGEARLIGQRLELTGMRSDGSTFPVELTLSRAEGEEFLVCGAIRDLSERLLAAEELRRREQDYRLLFDSNPHPMWVYDVRTLEFLAVNEAACRRYGYTADEFLSLTILDIRPPEEVPRLKEAIAEARRRGGQQAPRRFAHRARSGEVFEVEIASYSTEFEGREASVVFVVDVSERARLEEQLARAQRMEAVGRLAGGIAHDFRNILAVVSGYADRVARMRDEDALLDAAGELKAAGQRANDLTRQLLAFASGQSPLATALDPSDVIGRLEPLLRRMVTEQIELSVRLSPDLGAVKVDRSQFEQVLMNLVANARDALGDSGAVSIEVAPFTVVQGPSSSYLELDPGRYVVVAVSDTGPGIDRETRERIFDPFFTTKQDGTGLGLATVYAIVRQAGGNIWVYSEPGQGSVFKVYLPQTDELPEPAATPAPAAKQTGRDAPKEQATILLVEDDDGLRKLEELLLGEQGYHVLAASSGNEAVDLLAGAASVNLLISDVVLPGLSGPELAARTHARFPHAEVLFTSGYTETSLRDDAHGRRASFMEKPFEPDGFTAKVAELLGAGHPFAGGN